MNVLDKMLRGRKEKSIARLIILHKKHNTRLPNPMYCQPICSHLVNTKLNISPNMVAGRSKKWRKKEWNRTKRKHDSVSEDVYRESTDLVKALEVFRS